MKVYYKTSLIHSYLMGMLMAVLIIPGIGCIASGQYFTGFLFILFWVFLMSLGKGTKIDFENKRISFFSSVLWIKFDNWVPASEYKRFKILNINESRQMNSRVSSTTIRYRKTAIELAIPESIKFKRLAEDDLDEIRLLVEKLKTEFNYERIIPPKR